METVKCGYCDKHITTDCEIEYSREVNEFYCSPDCATSAYYNYMQSTVVDIEDNEIMDYEGVQIVKGKLCRGDD